MKNLLIAIFSVLTITSIVACATINGGEDKEILKSLYSSNLSVGNKVEVLSNTSTDLDLKIYYNGGFCNETFKWSSDHTRLKRTKRECNWRN